MSIGPSVDPSVGPSVCPVLFSKVKKRILGASCAVYPALLSYLKVKKFRYEYFIDDTAPSQLITAPAQPPEETNLHFMICEKD